MTGAGAWALQVRAGRPTAEELAAVVTALGAITAAAPVVTPPTPRWQRAARREGLGAAPATRPADVDTPLVTP